MVCKMVFFILGDRIKYTQIHIECYSDDFLGSAPVMDEFLFGYFRSRIVYPLPC